jgi:hypothetical protein
MAVERYERAVREAYLTATALKCAGLKLTLRNASEINGRQWYPSSLAWQALFLFREELPPLNKMSVRKRRHVNPTFLSMIEAQRRRLYKMKGYPFSSSSGKITGWMSRY